MIIVDLNQTMLSNLMMQLGNHTNAQLEEGMVRHMVLNAIRAYKTKFADEYGDMIIACDNRNYWRKQAFPYYKANRKKSQEASELNWQAIHECMNKIRSELKEFFPYKVIDVESCEADDIIATLVKEFSDFGNTENILILSGDKDFIQLHTNHNVKQYDPVRKKWIKHDDPAYYLFEHILKGDSGDGVPNVLSDDDAFILSTKKQKPLRQKAIDEMWIEYKDTNAIEKHSRNFARNKTLIDLSMIPQEIEEKILKEFNEQPKKDRSKLFNYFVSHKLKNLMESIQEF